MKQRVRILLSLAITVLFLWLALRGVNWSEVWTHLRGANPFWLALSILISTLSIHVRALRWKVLLEPVDPHVRWQPRVAGTAVGMAANNLIPARVGEIVRAVVAARLAKLPFSAVLASLVVERVLDGLVTVGLLLGVMALPGFPNPERARWVLGGVRIVAAAMTAAALVLITLAVMPKRSVRIAEAFAARMLPHRLRRPFLARLDEFISGLAVLRSPRLLVLSMLWAVAQWLFIPLSILCAFRAFGVEGPGYVGALFLQSAINLAVAIPAAPGFFGPLEAAATYGLALWGVEKARAVSFAIGYHLGGFTVVTLVGLWYVQRLHLSWRELAGTAEKGGAEGDDSLPGVKRRDERPAAARREARRRA
ncbi:lysylphosphatidylglycerol synthase transmembrane domain-containing protein [Longimicrobium sp.]|uniref:lysylphosphatidylglycerol synthase transmembrane domain-containing protein n=1 Tax=Longimicrobium sp. TaxID=2029185 RepID=UPI002BB0AE46|nr:lysylphosphatidylglycerol synthase transmembrane domain-containing protein [Longimicrobium sp.]HSU15243.1 lysylphosphatidylglycerol synthase transmembrane domain-containing protein [Longimicrobium sp.]